MNPDQQLFFNGIDGADGTYNLPPMALGELAATLRARRPALVTVARAAEAGIDPKDLASAGWGVVLPEGLDPAVRQALQPLLDHRKRLATRNDERLFRELTYFAGDTKRRFLPRHSAAPGPVDPLKIPYYLLLVGGPELIPFEFQHALAVQYAVGRIGFDTPEEYARYARSVIEHETRATPQARTAALFGVQNDDDPATRTCVEHLSRPLARRLAGEHTDWRFEIALGHAASRHRLHDLLSGQKTPALVFTAGHAVLFRNGHPRQRPEQGALLCADWPGPKAWHGAIPQEHVFAAHDVGDDAHLAGLVSFHFACCSTATPRFDSFARGPLSRRAPIAPGPFLARLPQRLLAHPRGGALAVIGHVDRAFEHSFNWDEAGSQIGVFASALSRIMAGDPVGLAMEHFGVRYAEISTELRDLELENEQTGKPSDDATEVRLWTAFQDARSYAIAGDPAVRLRSEGLV